MLTSNQKAADGHLQRCMVAYHDLQMMEEGFVCADGEQQKSTALELKRHRTALLELVSLPEPPKEPERPAITRIREAKPFNPRIHMHWHQVLACCMGAAVLGVFVGGIFL